LADDLPSLLAAAGPERLVIGNRLHVRPSGMSEIRYEWNGHLSRLVGLLAGASVLDGQSGFRVFHRSLATDIRISGRYTYTQEQIIRAARAGYRIVQPSVSFVERQSGLSRLMRSPLSYMAHVFDDLDRLATELQINVESSTVSR
jgi:hypothetical protein